jgi:predicted nucleic acid-binding protein
MIVVDTSVWVDALRGGRSARHGDTLQQLLDADEVALPLVVRLELMAGVARAGRRALRQALTALPVLRPTDETWDVVERWVDRSADAGHRFGLTDLLIAAMAQEVDALVWSLDADFERMAKLKLVRLYR